MLKSIQEPLKMKKLSLHCQSKKHLTNSQFHHSLHYNLQNNQAQEPYTFFNLCKFVFYIILSYPDISVVSPTATRYLRSSSRKKMFKIPALVLTLENVFFVKRRERGEFVKRRELNKKVEALINCRTTNIQVCLLMLFMLCYWIVDVNVVSG